MPQLQQAYLGSTPLFVDKPWFYKTTTSLSGRTDSTTTVTASATTHTKGSWTQLIASTSGVTTLLILGISNTTSATDTASLIDIGVGASGSETAIASNIAVGAFAGFIQIPVNIPSGSRISCRAQSAIASRAISITRITCVNMSGASLLPTSVDTLGTSTATSEGTPMSGSSGTWVEITASTSKDYIGFVIVPSSSDTDIAGGNRVYEIGVGASGSEVVFGAQVFNTTSSESLDNRIGQILVYGREVPSGSRIAIRHDITTNPGRYDACVIAIPKP